MARFRTYKNGLFAHRYKGYYVTRQDATENRKKTYSVVDANGMLIESGLSDYWDAEWEIDKLTASPELTKVIMELYSEDVFMLSKFFLELMDKENTEGLSEEEKEFFDWVKKIRSRKADGKKY